jgi:nucleoside-diphosphate kinase
VRRLFRFPVGRRERSAAATTEDSGDDFPLRRTSEMLERTLILLKPDCLERRLAGRILSRFEDKGFNFVAMKLMRVTPELSKKHYAEHVAKPFYPGLEAFITGGPVLALVLEGLDVIRVVREMLGATSGLKAAAGTIRGDYSSSRQMNLVHASDGAEAAAREIGLYFQPGEIVAPVAALGPWLKAGDE